jgi:hypothetical protein
MLHYWDELQGLPGATVAAAVDDASTDVEIAGVPLQIGDLVQVESEILEVEEVIGALFTVRRGSHNSMAAAHAAGTPVFRLDRKVHVIPFPRSFFGSPASGSFSYPVPMPNVRLACAEMYMTNDRGNGETSKISLTSTLDRGVRTYSGGQFTIQVEGYLAIQQSVAPPIVVERDCSIRDIFAIVRDAPTGQPLEMELRVAETALCTLTIAPGATTSNVVNGFGLGPLAAMSTLTLQIASVGRGGVATPGKDLTVTVRL